jgi:hypothetical protein
VKPLAIDLYCGLGGWADGLLAEGYDVVGFDIERHRYPARDIEHQSDGLKQGGAALKLGDGRPVGAGFNVANESMFRRAPLTGGWIEYPGQLVIQDVLTLHGSQFRDAALIVASPPCQEYSYMAMPWTRAKAKAAAIRADTTGAETERLTRLFDACFRIQREACEAAGRHIPLVVENVRGAIPWVGRSRWNFGSFHLWGDVPALMPHTFRATKVPGHSLQCGEPKWRPHHSETVAAIGLKANPDGTNHGSGSWFKIADSKNRGARSEGTKQPGLAGDLWWDEGAASFASKSPARKAASALIAKIPEPLARHIARTFHP